MINFINNPLIFRNLNEAFLSKMEEKATNALEMAAQENPAPEAAAEAQVGTIRLSVLSVFFFPSFSFFFPFILRVWQILAAFKYWDYISGGQ